MLLEDALTCFNLILRSWFRHFLI